MQGWTTPKDWEYEEIVTAAMLNEQIRDNSNFLRYCIAPGEAMGREINTGVITIHQTHNILNPQVEETPDDLDTINGGTEGDIVILRAATDTPITVKATGGNISMADDVILDDTHKTLILIFDGSQWNEIYRSSVTRTFTVNTFQYPAPGTDWTPQLEGAGLVASKTAKKCWLPLNFLKEGDAILSYKLVGDATEVTALTLDCKLVRINKADPLTTTDIPGGGITQITADGNFDSEATLTDPEIIATDKQYVLEINGTTDSDDSIIVIGAEIKIIRLD